MSDLSGMLEGAMKDPRFGEILSTLKEKADRGELDVASIVGEINDNATKDEGTPAVPASSGSKANMESHKQLLSALRPYLGDSKRGAVDGILKIGEFSGIIEALGKGKGGR